MKQTTPEEKQRAVESVIVNGEKRRDVAKRLKVNYFTLHNWIHCFMAEGAKGLERLSRKQGGAKARVTTTVRLEENEYRSLKATAAGRGVTTTRLVHEIITEWLMFHPVQPLAQQLPPHHYDRQAPL